MTFWKAGTEVVRRAAERAGLDKHVTPHTLRHTAATWLGQETGDARLVAAYLGHYAERSVMPNGWLLRAFSPLKGDRQPLEAHVASDELHAAAAAIARSGSLEPA